MSIISLLAQTPDYYSDPTYTDQVYTTTTLDPATASAVTAGTVVFLLIALAVAYVVTSFLLSRIFKKAGVETWKAWVPVYNNWVLLEIGGQQGFWALLALVPVVNIVAIVFYYIAMYHVGLKLDKGGAFVILAIFLPIVWMIWLAFDGSKWESAATVAQPQPPMPPAPTPTPPTIQY